jgi:hypothetical protein
MRQHRHEPGKLQCRCGGGKLIAHRIEESGMLHVQRLFVCAALLLIAGASSAETERTITVNGSGFVTLTPDIARLQLAVVERSPSVTDAQAAAAVVTERVLALLDKLRIDRKLVNTTSASVQPDYRWNQVKEQQELAGYIAQRTIEVELRDLDKLGELIEGAVKAGVNQLQPPMLDSSQRRDAYRAALALAAQDAYANAATLAKAMDAKLGKVVTLNAVEGGGPMPMPMMRMQADMAMAEAAPQTYNAGDLRFEALVTAVFTLTD